MSESLSKVQSVLSAQSLCFVIKPNLRPFLNICSSAISNLTLSLNHYCFLNQSQNLIPNRWYRAPELLLGAKNYADKIDMWSIGCIFAELMLRTPYLPGESDLEQLNLIYKALGTPKEDEWPVRRRTCIHFLFLLFSDVSKPSSIN